MFLRTCTIFIFQYLIVLFSYSFAGIAGASQTEKQRHSADDLTGITIQALYGAPANI
jgi:hypothetical protein